MPKFLVRTKMASVDKVGTIDGPKLFIHSTDDEVAPYQLGRRLFAAAKEPKIFYKIEGARHNETFLIGGAALIQALSDFVNSLLGMPTDA